MSVLLLLIFLLFRVVALFQSGNLEATSTGTTLFASWFCTQSSIKHTSMSLHLQICLFFSPFFFFFFFSRCHSDTCSWTSEEIGPTSPSWLCLILLQLACTNWWSYSKEWCCVLGEGGGVYIRRVTLSLCIFCKSVFFWSLFYHQIAFFSVLQDTVGIFFFFVSLSWIHFAYFFHNCL